jgi:membrane protein
MLLGAELNAEIEHASPYGKAVGEKVPGQRRAIGALAFGRYQKRPASTPALPAPPALPPVLPPAPAAGALRRALATALAVILVLRSRDR